MLEAPIAGRFTNPTGIHLLMFNYLQAIANELFVSRRGRVGFGKKKKTKKFWQYLSIVPPVIFTVITQTPESMSFFYLPFSFAAEG